MDEPSERPAGIVIVQHSFAPTWERRPEIHRVKRSSCQHVPIVDSKLEADVEGFLVVGKRRALIQPFFLNSDVAADVRRAHAPDGKFLFGSRGKVEKRFGGGKNSVARSFGDPVIGDVKEANGAAGLAQLLRYLTPPGGFLRVQGRNIYNGNLRNTTAQPAKEVIVHLRNRREPDHPARGYRLWICVLREGICHQNLKSPCENLELS